mmetsp:Transcript_7231/g.16552  ORF Transcript_7231/g.16552 Transcript_7231/m.16552 type:complete len:611 (+) Transcript_7231:180-2012(+)
MRPGTGNRGGTSYGAAPGTRGGPGTSMGGARPPGTGRLQSGLTSSMGRQAAQGIALQQGINITDRPTTMQGMKGMRATTAGPGRLVQDSTFFVGVLRGKVNSITEEIGRLQKEMDEHQRDQAQSVNMQRKAEELDGEVRKLEGTLADYNIAMDKMRQGTDPSELTKYIREYESRNRAFGNEIDRIFLQVKQEEQQTGHVDQQIEAVYQTNQAKIDAMDRGKVQRYKELVEQSMKLQERYQQQLAQVDAISDQAAMLQAQQEANTHNKQYRAQEQARLKLTKQMQSLLEELEITKLPPDEMQARMLAKVRSDNAQAQAIDDRVGAVKEELRKAEQTMAELTADLAERNSGGNSEKDKYEKLYARDREMTDFIDKYEETKGELEGEKQATEGRIVALLEHISQGLNSEQSMPDQALAKQMSEEASFKERQLESSQATMARLVAEKEQRMSEMDKIANLDEKIKIELASLGSKMHAMKAEMGAFDDLDGLRDKAANTKVYLQQQAESYKQRTKTSKEQVASLRRRYEEVKAELNGNETYKQMEMMEGRLRKYAQTIFTLNEYVETKGRETDYLGLKDKCMSMTNQLNSVAKEAILHQATNLSDAPFSSKYDQY